MNAIEAVAEGIRKAQGEWRGGSDPEFYLSLARGAVAALAGQGDITDEQIAEAVEQALYPAPTYRLDAIEAVRALLARQAAVHATREAELEAQVRILTHERQEARDTRDATRREAEAAHLKVFGLKVDNDLLRNRADRCLAAEAEVTALRATVSRVKALCDGPVSDYFDEPLLPVSSIRAALDPKGEGA